MANFPLQDWQHCSSIRKLKLFKEVSSFSRRLFALLVNCERLGILGFLRYLLGFDRFRFLAGYIYEIFFRSNQWQIIFGKFFLVDPLFQNGAFEITDIQGSTYIQPTTGPHRIWFVFCPCRVVISSVSQPLGRGAILVGC